MDIVQREYQRDISLKKDDVERIQEWHKGQPHLPEMTEQEIIWFLKSCYYSNELAKKTIDNYFTIKMMSPEILRNRDLERKILQDTMDVIMFAVLPQKTPEGHTILMSRFVDANPEHFNYNETIKLFDMLAMCDIHTNGTSDGFRCCFDMEGITFGHVTRLGIVSMKKFFYYLQEGMPVRLKGLHFFNITPAVDKIVSLMKPFLKKEVMEMLHLHQTVHELAKFVPLECFPSDYGGKCKSIAELQAQMKKDLIADADFFAYQDKQLVDENKRPGKPKNESDIFGVEGTFKKLDLD